MNNIPNIIEAALLLLVTFLVGCVIGWVLRAKIFKVQPTKVVDKEKKIQASPQTKTMPVAPLKSVPEVPKPAKPSNVTTATPKAAKPVTKANDNTQTQKPAVLSEPRGGKKDDLKKIKGVGPKLETTLNGLGIYHFDQIAQWTRKEIDWVDDYLSFKGRIDRDEWIAQAQNLKE